MRVSINGRPVVTSPDDGTTVEALVDSLREREEIPRDQVVVGLDVDRCALRGAGWERLGSAQLDESSEVAIATDDTRGYARRILTDARGMLSVLKEAARCLADEFRSGAPERANADLFNLLNALQCFLACLYHVSNTCGLQRQPLDSPLPLFDQVAGSLDAIESSQQRGDWASLSRQLEADLVPALDGFEPVLQHMVDSI
jgi:hypothetical protein